MNKYSPSPISPCFRSYAKISFTGVPKRRPGCGLRTADCGVRGQQKPKNKFKNNRDNKTAKIKRKTKQNNLMHTKIQLKKTREYN